MAAGTGVRSFALMAAMFLIGSVLCAEEYGLGKNGGYPEDVPTNRCEKCSKRFCTRTADATRYGQESWWDHLKKEGLEPGSGKDKGNKGNTGNDGNRGRDDDEPDVNVNGQTSNNPGSGNNGNGSNQGSSGGVQVPPGAGPELEGSPGADAAVNWAMNIGPTVDNPGTEGQGPNDWDNWCLRYINWAWTRGAGKNVPLLSGADARQSMNQFKNAGKLRQINGAIPKGAPVFWDYGTWGHIAMSIGRQDANGQPLIVSTWVGGSQHGIFVKPLSWFTAYVKSPAGWGVVPTTPVN